MSGHSKLQAVKRWLKDAFTKNIGLKIGALFFAFLLWAFVMAEQNPIREKTFTNIPVTYINSDSLRQNDLTSTVPFSDVLGTVSVTVEGNAERIYLLTEGMLSAEVDLSQIIDVGEKTLVVTPRSTMQGLDLRADPQNVTLDIESIVTQDVPVEVQLVGDQADWLYYGQPVLSTSTIEVSGASSNVEQVAKAVCKINIDSLEVTTKETRNVVLVDEAGNELPSSSFTNIPSVIVELPIYPKKTVAIDLKNISDTTTGLADGYEITGITVEPDSVQIAGTLQDIDTISSVRLEPIVLENAEIDQVVNTKVVLPEGAYAVIPSEVQVTLTIQPQQDSRTYSAVDIGVKNLGEGLEATLRPETVDVDANGTKADLDAFTADSLKPFVDSQGLGRGVHTVSIKFENEPDIAVTLVPSVTSVTVVIS